jgi:hypothetical protein
MDDIGGSDDIEKVPEEYKKLIDDLFKTFENHNIEKTIRHIPANTESDDFAREKALEELTIIRDAFHEFQRKSRDLVVFSYMIDEVQAFAQYAQDLTELVMDDINQQALSPETLKRYQSLQKLRAQILSAIYNKYGK